eukprot:9123707-Pyramimonas_sp.AAC.1
MSESAGKCRKVPDSVGQCQTVSDRAVPSEHQPSIRSRIVCLVDVIGPHRLRVSGVLSAPLPFLAQEDP